MNSSSLRQIELPIEGMTCVSRAALQKIRQNLFFVYNILEIPLAAIVMLNPVIAGAAMAMRSVSVVSNSLLLKRWQTNRE
ncbi:MAG: hypothetical protein K2P74_11750 [Nitrosomonas sp.]|nr:hypothetical protein [Nitrosomonas sp.]